MKKRNSLPFIFLLTLCFAALACGSGAVKNSDGVYEFQPGAFRPKKFPVEIPFHSTESRLQNYYQIESIFCTGKARGSRSTGGYTFVVKGRAVKDSSNLSMGRRTFELLPLAASSSAVTGMATAYIFPQVPAGEPFEFEFTGLFDGYFDVSDFGGFLLTD